MGRINLRMPADTHSQAKDAAWECRKSLNAWIVDAINEKLKKENRMSISMEIQQARVYGQTEIALDATVEDVVAWLQDELGREVEPDVDYFVSAQDSDTYGNEIRTISFSDDTGIDLQVIVNA